MLECSDPFQIFRSVNRAAKSSEGFVFTHRGSGFTVHCNSEINAIISKKLTTLVEANWKHLKAEAEVLCSEEVTRCDNAAPLWVDLLLRTL